MYPLSIRLIRFAGFFLLGYCVCNEFASRSCHSETVTHFGDFADGFGPVPIPYSSDVPYSSGSFVSLFHEGVSFIPKFDASLGTLTDVTVFVSPTLSSSPIFYSLGGTMTAKKADLGAPGYSGSVSLMADLSLNYKEGDGVVSVISEPLPLTGDAAGAAGTIEFTTSVTPAGVDGMLTGSKSIFDSIDLDDFVGTGFVDSLYVDLIIEDTADFALDNATATASLAFDVFDSDSGIDDAVIGVTYTYSIVSVPEPSAVGSLSALLGLCFFRRRRRTNE